MPSSPAGFRARSSLSEPIESVVNRCWAGCSAESRGHTISSVELAVLSVGMLSLEPKFTFDVVYAVQFLPCEQLHVDDFRLVIVAGGGFSGQPGLCGPVARQPEVVSIASPSHYHETKVIDVELFTWEKLDRIDDIKREFGL